MDISSTCVRQGQLKSSLTSSEAESEIVFSAAGELSFKFHPRHGCRRCSSLRRPSSRMSVLQ